MEEEEGAEDATLTQRQLNRSNSQPSIIHRSIQTNLNRNSQLSFYHSIPGTLYQSAISINSSFQSAASTRSVRSAYSGDSVTIRYTNRTIMNNDDDDDDDDDEDFKEDETTEREIRSNSHYNLASSLYFRDEIRSVDFVLVWDEHDAVANNYKSVEVRRIFEKNLELEGLELEYERPEPNGLCFIKIHVPLEVLRCYSELLKLRMPMKAVPGYQVSQSYRNIFVEEVNSFFRRILKRFYVDERIFPKMSHRLTAVYSRDKEYLFDLDTPEFFTSATHSRIVQFILDRTKFTEDKEDDFAFGIERLIAEKAYVAAYPLHDGDLRTPDCMRYLLYTEWASVRKCFRYQPLDYVKEYFGVKIGLYFAWLGFYTQMLIPPSIVGLLCFIYSCITLIWNQPSEDICLGKMNVQMCPLCDRHCKYWNLNETCVQARITYLSDNPSTVFFAIFMSFWATLFLELWKRYSAEITHRWDLTGLDAQEEHPRPQYLARLFRMKKKPEDLDTDEIQEDKDKLREIQEPSVSFWKMKLPAILLSSSIILLLIVVAMATVLAVVLYRMSVLTAYWLTSYSYAILFTTATAACINLCCIFIFNWIYVWLAEYLTEIELLRTQTEFDDSLTLKIYLLQFVNYYASIFYIAFFKGKFIGYPAKYNRFFGYRQEECGPGGCLMELCIQLSIIMVGKQAMNTVLEMLFPLFFKWLNTLKVHVGSKKVKNKRKSSSRMFLQWVRDYKLVQWGPRSLFPEYLEMVLQYGFVTIFVAAFPLAPFFALLNNVLEMRLDAKKLIVMYRRPVSYRVKDIGVWYRILDSISKLSVMTNAFIIAFTSDFIPRLVYMMTVSKDKSLTGFLDHSLSVFNTSHFDKSKNNETYGSLNNELPPEICRYPDYREPPHSVNKYDHTTMYWHVLAARLAFVVVFENVVAVLMILMRWCIPNMTQKLRDQIRREIYITNEIIIQQEALRVCNIMPCELNGENITRRNISNNENAERLNRVMCSSLSNSEFDLEVHGSPLNNLSTNHPTV